MEESKTITCMLCDDEVNLNHMDTENKVYFDHLETAHHIEFYRHLTLMLNLMDENCLEHFSSIIPPSKPKSLVCLLCRKENSFNDYEGDQYFNHLKHEHMIINNFQLIKALNLMDSNGHREIIKKFEETYEVDDDELDKKDIPVNDYVETGSIIAENIFAQNDFANMVKRAKYDEERLIGDEATLEDSMRTTQYDEEIRNGSEIINYNSKSLDAEKVEQANVKALLNDPNSTGASFPDSSINQMEHSSSDLSQDARKSPSRNTSKKSAKSKPSDFSKAVNQEIEKGNLSTRMDIPYEKTHKKMKLLTGLFMIGLSCKVCDRGFNNKSHLHEHIESLHNPFHIYFCLLCQLPMTSSAKYRQHKRKCMR